MSAEGLRRDILNQPESLAQVFEYNHGPGSVYLAAAASELRNARRIIVTGMGASLFSGIPLQYYLASRGFPSMLVETAELLHHQRAICAGAVVVLISRSGETVEVSKLLDAIDSIAASTIAVTNIDASEVGKGARHVLLVSSTPDELVAINSYTGALMTLLELGWIAASEPEPQRETGVAALLSSFPGMVRFFFSASEEWRPFLEGAKPLYFLGRGPSVGSCSEAALLMAEVAKSSAIAMPAGGFRHGPVEVVDDDFRAVVFAPSGAGRALNLDLARDLKLFGGQVRVIGPCKAGDGAGELSFWPTPEMPEMVAPALEIIPAQIAALRLAEWRGIPAGEFRFVSTVTRDEGRFAPSYR